ncbi:ZIP family metal transporter [Dechloromonas sp. XY25]|uniref:ZIP family metal transporter n=1 Tax=Dechloromonas hankyongensis TaxID=2908002 RepID=A0ABS9K2F9_9RHOO|nr:ZIP family metal transporter [Dechloromonas hankyongensis]MCG2577328.1 ZIP family metal transporter [Dechloromonas hankyongensis]
MSTFSWIIAVSLAGGVLSVLAAAALSISLGVHRVGMLISYAIGALLGAAFLEILPHALEHGDPHKMAGTVLFGILVFFVLEKLVLWRHCHHDHCEAHEAHAPAHDHGRSGLLILVGDTFHNFVDGILIAAAFLENTELGIVTALAIIAHEIPQEVGDYLILLHSGYSKVKALAFNLLSSLATLIGAMLAYFALSELNEWIPSLLGLAAASMIYVAVADLIPGLHKRTELKATVQQVVLIAMGIASIGLVRTLVGE